LVAAGTNTDEIAPTLRRCDTAGKPIFGHEPQDLARAT
jgi:hypothetical protein